MFLSKLRNLFSSKITALFTMGAASVGTISCVYGPDPGCCGEYPPGLLDNYSENELDTYQQMCLSLMDTREEYDRQANCKLKMADRYIYSAEDCCAPLKSDISVQFFNRADFDEKIHYDYYFLYTMLGRDNYSYNPVYMPTNAYTYCLLNTDPYTNRCNIDDAQMFEQDLNKCCKKAIDSYACIESFILNNNQCNRNDIRTQSCCDRLADQDTDEYLSKSKCEEVYNRTQKCVETKLDACCRNVPDYAPEDGLTREICEEIYTTTSGTCVNDDAKYQQYLDSQQ